MRRAPRPATRATPRRAAAPFAAFLLALIPLAPLAGCEETLTEDNFNQITVGMSLDSVRNLLGSDGVVDETSGVSISGAGVVGGSANVPKSKTYVWKDGKKQIILEVADNKVIAKREIGVVER